MNILGQLTILSDEASLYCIGVRHTVDGEAIR